eukprot:4918903-Amphidinium_carterae.1
MKRMFLPPKAEDQPQGGKCCKIPERPKIEMGKKGKDGQKSKQNDPNRNSPKRATRTNETKGTK